MKEKKKKRIEKLHKWKEKRKKMVQKMKGKRKKANEYKKE